MPSARAMMRSSISRLLIVIGPLTRSFQVTSPSAGLQKFYLRRVAKCRRTKFFHHALFLLRARRPARWACCSSGRPCPRQSAGRSRLGSVSDAAFGRPGLRRNPAPAISLTPKFDRLSLGWTGPRRCLRCAARTGRRGGAQMPSSTGRCGPCRGEESPWGRVQCGCERGS
jgi:hypothetical protein